MNPTDILEVSEVARALGISRDYVHCLADDGKLPSMKTTRGQRLFFRRDVERCLAERDAAAAAAPKKKTA